MSTKETKEKLNRLRARRGGHRGVSTKLMKEAMELLQTPEAENIERCEIIAAQLKEKVTLLTQIDRRGNFKLMRCERNPSRDRKIGRNIGQNIRNEAKNRQANKSRQKSR